jgi:hypothetical protein
VVDLKNSELDVARAIASFEALGVVLLDRGRIRPAMIQPVLDTVNCWCENHETHDEDCQRGFAISAFKHGAYALVRDHGAYVALLVPGANIKSHPFSPMIETMAHGSDAALVLNFAAMAVRRDGIRPSPIQIKAIAPDWAPALRGVTIAACRLWNEPDCLASGIEVPFAHLKQAIGESERTGRDDHIRDLLMSMAPADSLSTTSEQLYGALWDLSDLVAKEQTDAVHQGIWGDFSRAARSLAAASTLISEISLALICTATVRPGRLSVAVDSWLGTIEGTRLVLEAERLRRTIAGALAEWQHEARIACANLLLHAGYINTENERSKLLRAWEQCREIDLKLNQLNECAGYLMHIGCWDFARTFIRLIEIDQVESNGRDAKRLRVPSLRPSLASARKAVRSILPPWSGK